MTNTMYWTITEYNKWIKGGRPINLLVTNLNISYSNIDLLPITKLKGIENLVNLTELYCYDNQLRSLNGIENLVNLTKLHCDSNRLTSLKGIENLVNLTTLHCSSNQLTSLNEIENLVNLTDLRCSKNQLTSLNGIKNLVNLTTLNCGNNQLISLKGIKNLVNLTELYCYDNQLTSLNGIENLVNLTELNCSNNQLTSLNGIENLVNLTELYCYDNQLTSLNGIENLVNLTYLDCDYNQLTSLKGIKNSTNLTTLHCSHNQLTSLKGIKNLVNLTSLKYENNQLTDNKLKSILEINKSICTDVFNAKKNYYKILTKKLNFLDNKFNCEYTRFEQLKTFESNYTTFVQLAKIFDSSEKLDDYIQYLRKIKSDQYVKFLSDLCECDDETFGFAQPMISQLANVYVNKESDTYLGGERTRCESQLYFNDDFKFNIEYKYCRDAKMYYDYSINYHDNYNDLADDLEEIMEIFNLPLDKISDFTSLIIQWIDHCCETNMIDNEKFSPK
jgi:Leucine-rich repeat (LRR) protein